METLKLLVQVIIFLLSMSMLINCNQGWSVAGIELSPSDTTNNTVFIEVISHDSTVHWYTGNISDGNNWCFKHGEMEDVRVK